jgi:hypothetical protein
LDVTRRLFGSEQDAVVKELAPQRLIETGAPAASHCGEEQTQSASIGDFDSATPFPASRDVCQRRELQGWVEDEPSTIGHEAPQTELYDDAAICVDRRRCAEIEQRIYNALSGSSQEETKMAKKAKKAKKKRKKTTRTTTKVKMRGPKSGKQVKGAASRMSDPCEGGE